MNLPRLQFVIVCTTHLAPRKGVIIILLRLLTRITNCISHCGVHRLKYTHTRQRENNHNNKIINNFINTIFISDNNLFWTNEVFFNKFFLYFIKTLRLFLHFCVI